MDCNSTRQPDQAYARTNETKRFPGWAHPPTSDSNPPGNVKAPNHEIAELINAMNELINKIIERLMQLVTD